MMEATILSLAADCIKKFEGCKLKAYLCPAGVWTIGWGRTTNVTQGDTYTQQQADAWLDTEVREFLDQVLRLTFGTPTTRCQHAAMVSLAYNIGVASFAKSSVRRSHCAQYYKEAADAFLMWNKATVGGLKVVLKGLDNRRKAERTLYLVK